MGAVNGGYMQKAFSNTLKTASALKSFGGNFKTGQDLASKNYSNINDAINKALSRNRG